MRDIERNILELVDYGIDKKLIEKRDSIYVINRLLDRLNLQEFKSIDFDIEEKREIWDILED